ncbi:VOC family protein [Mucilaginibacter kameinonensis]|uniref:VOC family protein n=1 Tax=Mucilaginibacter kameinonensis TaxID=452286 RepID=UPI000EF77349|nr:VOC family protein [Mucilaginibacter kameinonensis]
MKTSNHTRLSYVVRVALITVSFISSLALNKAKAQAPGIIGIDHVGINVPDMDQAIKFFHDMFGFTPVTKLGPFPMDANWKSKFHIHENANQVELVMMRAGDGSNIELFTYNPNAGSQQQPYRDDLSATHFSLYTSDINATKSFLESKGIKFVSDINSGAGDTEGEKWVYFETPWGATIELNSYPHGKGYEKNNPQVRLWSPKDNVSTVALTTETISPAQLSQLAKQHLQVWNDHDQTTRLKEMQTTYTADIAFFDADQTSVGYKGMNNFIEHLLTTNKGFKFSLAKISANHNIVRLYWNFGPAVKPALISGMDLIIVENGKIKSLSAFLDHLPAKSIK